MNVTCEYDPVDDGDVSWCQKNTNGRWQPITYDGELLNGLDNQKYSVADDGKSLSLTIFNVTFGNHSYACRSSSNETFAITCLTVNDMPTMLPSAEQDNFPRRTIIIAVSVIVAAVIAVAVIAVIYILCRRRGRAQLHQNEQLELTRPAERRITTSRSDNNSLLRDSR